MSKNFKFKTISEWWFGTDILDLFRNFNLEINKKNKINSELFLLNNMFSKIIDNIQLEIDKKNYQVKYL